MAQNKELNVLAFYDDIEKQNHRKWWTYEKVFSLITEPDTLPPFQLILPFMSDPVISMKLVNFDTNVETNILANAYSTGLEHVQYETEYDIIIYPSVLPLLSNLKNGKYYIKISSLTITKYSDVFVMCDVSKMIKIEYWHNEDFIHPKGHIRYKYPFRNRVYIKSDIAKPEYPYEEKVIKREGFVFPIQQISYKLYKFEFLGPEYLFDAIRVIRMHDNIEISQNNNFYDVDELLMISPKWENEGDIGIVNIEFKTDTVVVVNGRAFDSVDYAGVNGNCLDVSINCVARIDEGSPEYVGGYWLEGTNQIPFENGDHILKNVTGGIVAEQWNGSAFVAIQSTNEQIAYDSRDNEYYFYETDSFKKPYIDNILGNQSGGYNIFGKTFKNSVLDIYVVDTPHIYIKSGISGVFNNNGIDIGFINPTNNRFFFVARSAFCNNIDQSNHFLV